MNRWKLGLIGLTLGVSGLLGCKQQLFISEPDYEHYRSMSLALGGPADLADDPAVSLIPNKVTTPKPPTVSDPDREPRPLTLQEAIQIALQQGNIGSQNPLFPGIGLDQNNVTAAAVFSDSIRVVNLDPAIAAANIEASLAKFDTHLIASMTWNKTDAAIANGLQSFQNGDSANLSTGLFKPLPTGGTAGVTFNTSYTKLESAPTVGSFATINPSYKPQVLFQLEQPLLQNYGVEINQLNPSHPGSILTNALGPLGGRVEGILITRLRADQVRADFELQVNYMLVNVEYAYWNLYSAYGNLYARDQALIDAVEVWKDVYYPRAGQLERKSDERRVAAQVETFRGDRITALGQVIEAERQLRALLGMGFDGKRLVPTDTPTKAGVLPEWQSALDEAMINRPELTIARQDLKFRQFDIMIQKNLLKPDLRAFTTYDINGVGTQLDGSQTKVVVTPDPTVIGGFRQTVLPQNALASLTNDKFNSWQIGLRLTMPLGFRDAHSAVRVARLNLVRSYATLRDTERKTAEQLRVYYARLDEYYQTMRARKAEYLAAAEEYELLRQRLKAGIDPLPGLAEQILNAQQVRVGALSAWYRAVADYNNTLAGFQFAKGTILGYDSVNIAEGPLPIVAQSCGEDHVRERQAALKLRERSDDAVAPTGTYRIDQDPAANMMPKRDDDLPAPAVPEMLKAMQRPAAPATSQPVQPATRPSQNSTVQPASMPSLPPPPPVVPGVYQR